MQKVTMMKGLRWSPKPMKEYLAAWNLGPGVARLHSEFTRRPDVWNLFWLSAPNCEKEPYLTVPQIDYVKRAAKMTADAVVGGEQVGSLAVRLMPLDFIDFMEANLKGDQQLELQKMLYPHWIWAMRHRAPLFYQARKSDQGLDVRSPISQGETILDSSTNIVSFFRFNTRGTRG